MRLLKTPLSNMVNQFTPREFLPLFLKAYLHI